MSGHIPWSITLALILGQTCMRELTEKTDRGGTFYRLLSFPPTNYREYLFLFFFFFVVSIRQKRFHALANFLSQVNRSIINDEKAWTKIETVSIVSGSYIINLSIKLNRLTNSISWTVIEKEGRSLGRKSFLHKLPSWCIILANLVVSRLSFE